MDLPMQLIQLGLAMPPIVSAVISIICCALVWFGGKKILAKIETQAAPILKELAAQSQELGTQSAALIAIKIQTTKTNGKVEHLDKTLTAHTELDEGRHIETTAGLVRNQVSTHKLRDQLSDFAVRVLLTKRPAKPEPTPDKEE